MAVLCLYFCQEIHTYKIYIILQGEWNDQLHTTAENMTLKKKFRPLLNHERGD